MSFVFATKGRTLQRLSTQLTTARVLPMVIVSHFQWIANKNDTTLAVTNHLSCDFYIVRSSCKSEDQKSQSLAGAFLTIQNVPKEDIGKSIDLVFDSYSYCDDDSEVLIQPMLSNVLRSGVIFSHDPNTCSPYRTISWHEGSDTSVVTSGRGGMLWHQVPGSELSADNWKKCVISMIDELLDITGQIPIDCEFAITKDDSSSSLWLLQVRPLILSRDPEPVLMLQGRVRTIETFLIRTMKPHPFLFGSRTIFGVMPDWNPAEIIGVRPRPLALSLYRELITDSIWAYQRHNYGYRNLRSFPLMTHFWGQPYIDVRVSFNSFIPADLDATIGEKLVEYYLNQLENYPHLHDKIESGLVLSCYSFDISERLRKLKSNNFTQSELRQIEVSLRHLTNNVIRADKSRLLEDETRIAQLKPKRERLLNYGVDELEQIFWLLEDGKRYGTLPFAGLARAGFIGVQIIESLVKIGLLSASDRSNFMSNLATVSSEMISDKLSLSRNMFLQKYGHLRPGTYDIRSPRYDEAPDLYFGWNEATAEKLAKEPFALTEFQKDELANLIKANQIDSTPNELLNFCQRSIVLRELSKFEFTKNVSDALSLISSFGQKLGFSNEEMSFCDIQTIVELYRSPGDPKTAISNAINNGKIQFEHASRLCLPALVVHPSNVWFFETPASEPNYITQKNVTAPVTSVDDFKKLRGSIVAIPSADPGYDWLFAQGISGLITEWGGANSHMAIRAGELGIPAVVGAGEIQFRNWSRCLILHIDCETRSVEVIS